MVPTAGLEPAQVAPLAPQTSASTNFATSARIKQKLMHQIISAARSAPVQAASQELRVPARQALV